VCVCVREEESAGLEPEVKLFLASVLHGGELSVSRSVRFVFVYKLK
jgi:hypothetical protein